MRVLQLNSDLDLGLKTEGPLSWLLPSGLRADTIERLARLTRLDEARIPAPTPYDSDQPTRYALYCRRCVFLNHAEVESPYWQETWLTARDSACEIHRLPLATLRARLVRESHNMLGLLKEGWSTGAQATRACAPGTPAKAALARSLSLLARSQIPNT